MLSKTSKTVLFSATFIVGFLIAVNFNFGRNRISSNLTLNAEEYQNAVETKNNLVKQVANLKENNEELNNKINNYNNSDVDNDKIVADMKNQVKDYGMLTGLNEVKGKGLVITINDAVINNKEDTRNEAWSKTLHNTDMAMVLNEIRYAGAEAIAINDHRVSGVTSVSCNYAFLGFEDETTEYAPFNIYIIGEPETLKASLFKEGSYLNRLSLRGLSIECESKDLIVMPAAKLRKYEYAENYVNKK